MTDTIKYHVSFDVELKKDMPLNWIKEELRVFLRDSEGIENFKIAKMSSIKENDNWVEP